LLAPAVVPSFEWTDVRDPQLAKFERHTGAGGFVWSSAVKNHISVARDQVLVQG
jgi:isocitrate lyase